MAKNIIFQGGNRQRVECTQPATPASGDPVLFGDRAGVAETAEDATTGRATVLFECVAELNVNGVDGSGNSAVKAGDVIYYVTGDTIKLSKKNSGVRFGVVMSKPGDTAAANLIAGGSSGVVRVFVGL